VTEVPAALLPTKIEAAVPHPAEAQAAPQPAPTNANPPVAVGSFDPVSGPSPAVVNPSVVDPSTAAVPPAPPPQTAALPVAPSAGDGSGAAVGAPQIMIRATADSWVQLVQLRDGARSVLLARVLKAGESYRVPEGTGLSMRTGNAGGLEITVGGNLAPAIGPIGAVRRHVLLDPEALMAGTAVRD
jgi:cytoskeleton protein RodZ